MAPVITDGIDTPVWATGQLIATLLTFGLALFVVIWVATLCRRERIVWPVLVVISGGAFLAFRAKADQQSPVPVGFHPSENRSAVVPVTLSVGPALVTARQGSTFALNIILSRGHDVSSVPVLISYDPLIMRVVSVSSGEFLSRDGQAQITPTARQAARPSDSCRSLRHGRRR